MHAENVSSSRVPAERLYQSQRSRLLYALAHWPRSDVFALVLLTFLSSRPHGWSGPRCARAGAVSETLSAACRLAESCCGGARFAEQESAITLPPVRPATPASEC